MRGYALKTLQIQSTMLGLSLVRQQQLKKRWDSILPQIDAFTPHELKGVVSEEEVVSENEEIGEFASEHMKQTLLGTSQVETFCRMQNEECVVSVGYGQGHCSHWLREATLAGYKTVWIDVSSVGCENARNGLTKQLNGLAGENFPYNPPLVIQGEFRTILADPTSVGLDPQKVRIWRICRGLGCYSYASAQTVLRQLGTLSLSEEADPSGKNRVELVVALKEDNPGRKGKQSKLYSLRQILNNLSHPNYGARPLVDANNFYVS